MWPVVRLLPKGTTPIRFAMWPTVRPSCAMRRLAGKGDLAIDEVLESMGEEVNIPFRWDSSHALYYAATYGLMVCRRRFCKAQSVSVGKPAGRVARSDGRSITFRSCASRVYPTATPYFPVRWGGSGLPRVESACSLVRPPRGPTRS